MQHLLKSLVLQSLGTTAPRFSQPLFIVSAPRSGSSYLYEIVRRMQGVWSFDQENDALWWQFFPYERLSVPSDYIDSDEWTSATLNSFMRQLVIRGLSTRKRLISQEVLQHWLLRQPIFYVEKTVANCFHLDALAKLFPDALFIHLVRDGRACISSMLEGWNSGFFWQRPLPLPEGATISHWCYPIPPGWPQVIDRPLEEICAWSWIEHNRYVLERRESDAGFASRCLCLTYEDLLAEPAMILEKIADFTGLAVSQDCKNYLKEKRPSWTTISQPKADKWKEKNPKAISRITPLITPMMHALGYQL